MDIFGIAKTVYKVSDFVSWQRSEGLVLSPSFQRRPSWKPRQKSFLIDTVLRGLPTPVIYLRERIQVGEIESLREVVDGQQRLRTLFAYIDPELLADYDDELDTFELLSKHDDELAGLPFARLPREAQRRIMNYEFSTHILPADTQDREVLEIFARINSSGTALNAQELRNARFLGHFKRAVYELGFENLERWRTWDVFDEFEIARMQEAELVSDLLMLLDRGLQGKTRARIDDFYDKHEDEYAEERVATRRFRIVMDLIEDQVGDKISETSFSRSSLFYTLFGLYYDLAYGLGSPLKPIKARSVRSLRRGLLQASDEIKAGDLDDVTAKALRGATSDLGTRKARLDFVRRACGLPPK